MPLILSFLVLSVVATVFSAPAINTDIKASCNAVIDQYSSCTADVRAPGGCPSTIVNFRNTIFSKCNAINFFWGQPDNNMTFIFETSFTQARQAYKISLANSPVMTVVLHVYRIFNNQETEVTTHDDRLVQVSDSNYQVILKFQGPASSTHGGVIVNYQAFKL